MRLNALYVAGAFLVISNSYAQVYRTLPKGVRMVAYRNVNTTKIDATYNQSQAAAPIAYDMNANGASLKDSNQATRMYFEQLRAINPQAADDLSLGEFQVSAEAQMTVHGFGAGYGINEKLTFYGILPYYNARVDMKYKQISGSNAQQVSDQVQASGQGDVDSAIANITASLPSVTGELVQSVVVNTFKYDEVGSWQGAGYGDAELGAMWRVVDRGTWGFALTGGVVAPTGKVDDPDLLQDIAFGDGQWDAFIESAQGFSVSDSLSFGSTVRYTYQAAGEKELRVPTSRDFTLSAQKGDFTVKYGDRVDAVLMSTYAFNDWFSVTPAYEFNYQMSSVYESPYKEANEYLAYNSDRIGHVARLTSSISSVQPFLKKKFVLPAVINVVVQQTVGGKNIPKMGRFEVELRMLF